MTVVRTSDRLDPAADMRLSATLLGDIAAGRAPASARVFRPGPTAAFGRLDVVAPGYEAACAIAAARGYVPVVRHAGGHVALYDEGCVIVELLAPAGSTIGGLEPRFRALVELLTAALGGLGIELELGELPGEYCPGRFSLHLPEGGPKVAGVAQRVVRGASLTAAVVTVRAEDRLRSLVAEVYAALGLALDPGTVGAIADRHPLITPQRAADAIAGALEARARALRTAR